MQLIFRLHVVVRETGYIHVQVPSTWIAWSVHCTCTYINFTMSVHFLLNSICDDDNIVLKLYYYTIFQNYSGMENLFYL